MNFSAIKWALLLMDALLISLGGLLNTGLMDSSFIHCLLCYILIMGFLLLLVPWKSKSHLLFIIVGKIDCVWIMGCIALSVKGKYIGVQYLEGKKPSRDISYTIKYSLHPFLIDIFPYGTMTKGTKCAYQSHKYNTDFLYIKSATFYQYVQQVNEPTGWWW